MNKTWLSVSIVAMLAAAGCSQKANVDLPPTPNPSPQPTETAKDAETIFQQKLDLNKDGKLDTVSLMGFDKRYVLQIEQAGKTQEIEINTETPETPMDLTVLDLTGDGQKEIAYRMSPGGTGKGIVHLKIFAPEVDGTYKEIPVQVGHDPDFRLTLQNNLTYELLDPQTNQSWTLQLDEDRIKQTGNPNMSGKKLAIDPPFEWYWSDLDNDGKIELVSKRAVWINTHLNMLFSMQTPFKWDGKAWIAQPYTIQPEPGVQLRQ